MLRSKQTVSERTWVAGAHERPCLRVAGANCKTQRGEVSRGLRRLTEDGHGVAPNSRGGDAPSKGVILLLWAQQEQERQGRELPTPSGIDFKVPQASRFQMSKSVPPLVTPPKRVEAACDQCDAPRTYPRARDVECSPEAASLPM